MGRGWHPYRDACDDGIGIRWYRFAQPPATSWEAFGFGAHGICPVGCASGGGVRPVGCASGGGVHPAGCAGGGGVHAVRCGGGPKVHPAGMPACSRWLRSAATIPPEDIRARDASRRDASIGCDVRTLRYGHRSADGALRGGGLAGDDLSERGHVEVRRQRAPVAVRRARASQARAR